MTSKQWDLAESAYDAYGYERTKFSNLEERDRNRWLRVALAVIDKLLEDAR